MEETDVIPVYRSRKTVVPEIESYLHLLVVIKLLDCNNIDKVTLLFVHTSYNSNRLRSVILC